MPQKTLIKGLKIVTKMPEMLHAHDKRELSKLSHMVIGNFPDYHTGSYYEIMYFHLN